MTERMTTSETSVQNPRTQRQHAIHSEHLPHGEETPHAQQAAPAQGNWREHIAVMREHAKQLGLAGHHLPSSAEMADVMQHNAMVELALNALEAAESSREHVARDEAARAEAASAADAERQG